LVYTITNLTRQQTDNINEQQTKTIMKTFDRYKQNLRQDGNKIISYTTHVATIDGDTLNQLGWWSVTTQKHINYAANQLNLTLIK